MSLVESDLELEDPDEDATLNIRLLMAGDSGLVQGEASMGIEPDGDFVTAWTQYEEYTGGGYYFGGWYGSYYFDGSTNNNIYVREMDQDTDTAGPTVTDFLLPSGERLVEGDEVNTELNHIVVTFDEELTTLGDHSVLDTDNWALLKDGVEISDGISEVYFGMNKQADFASELGGSSRRIEQMGSRPRARSQRRRGGYARPGRRTLRDRRQELASRRGRQRFGTHRLRNQRSHHHARLLRHAPERK